MGQDETSPPDRFRQQHGDGPGPAVVRGEQITDAAGDIGAPYRVRDTVAILEGSGKLDKRAAEAARRFRDDFAMAHLDGYQVADLSRVLGSGQGGDGPSHHIIEARDRVWHALRHLGGIGTPGAMIAWHVLGLGETLKHYGRREWASGALVSVCHALAACYAGVTHK